MRRPARLAVAAVALAAAAVVLAGCGIGASSSPRSVAPGTPIPGATISPAVLQTRAAIVAAFAPSGLQLTDSQRPYRPAESNRVAGAPRAVYQALLPEDPDGGFIVVYEFPDSARAIDAGNDLAGYLGSGAGRIQFPRDARHTIRQVGTTLIFFSWSPSGSPDPRTPQVADALATLGIGFTPPN